MIKVIIIICVILFLTASYLLFVLGRKEKANKEKLRRVLNKMAKLQEERHPSGPGHNQEEE